MTRLEVGRLAKAHGLRGEISVVLTTDLTRERTRPGAVLYADDTQLTVASSRPHRGRFIVKFEGVNSREAADRLRGKTLTAEPLSGNGDLVFAHDVIGRTLKDQHGVAHGQVVSLVANPASDLMELANGLLVPMVFYVSHTDDEVLVDVPDGLLNSHED